MWTTLISAPALLAALKEGAPILLLDCRHDLGDPEAGRRAYGEGHLPGAHFMHLDEDLSGDQVQQGVFRGRHPLPSATRLAARLETLGATAERQIACYDAQGGMFAARAWWLLRWLGHTAVAVLDGGMPAWQRAGGALTSAPSPTAAGCFTCGRAQMETVDAAGMQAALAELSGRIIDARAPDRFRGENETLDPVGGHIPGARNRFFRDNLDTDGCFKSAAQLREEWKAVLTDPAGAIMQCGSGVTACHNLLALEHAGLPGARLYPGSWSEWCADPARPVERN